VATAVRPKSGSGLEGSRRHGGGTDGKSKERRHECRTSGVCPDRHSANEENLARIDYADVIALAQELELLEGQRGLDSFARAGLVK
jgi:hypothetical protein